MRLAEHMPPPMILHALVGESSIVVMASKANSENGPSQMLVGGSVLEYPDALVLSSLHIISFRVRAAGAEFRKTTRRSADRLGQSVLDHMLSLEVLVRIIYQRVEPVDAEHTKSDDRERRVQHEGPFLAGPGID